MGEIIFGKLKQEFNEGNSLIELWFEPSNEEIETILLHIKMAKSVLGEERASYIYGEGKQPKSSYEELRKQGIDVIWKGLRGPSWIKMFSFLIASYHGLIKVKNINWIKPSILKLSNLSAVSFYSFQRKSEKIIIDSITKGDWKIDPINLVRSDPSHFVFILDGDNAETKSGLLAILIIGKDCPEDLKSLGDNYGEVGYIGQPPR